MMMRWLLPSIVFSVALVSAAPAEETIQTIEVKAKENWLKVKTLSATTRLESERIYPDRNIKKLTTGSYYFMRDDEGRELVRQELETTQDTEMTMGKDKPMTTIPNHEKRIMVSDGRTIKSLAEGTRGSQAAIMFIKARASSSADRSCSNPFARAPNCSCCLIPVSKGARPGSFRPC